MARVRFPQVSLTNVMTSKYTPDAHLVSAVFYFILGIWWTIGSVLQHMKRTRKKQNQHSETSAPNKLQDQHSYTSSVPMPFCPRLPFQAILLILFAIIGFFQLFIVREVDATGNAHVKLGMHNLLYHEDGKVIIMKVQHLTMDLAFLLYGIIDLLMLCVPYPKRTSQLAFSLSMLVVAVVYYYHDLGHSLLETIIHQLIALNSFIITAFAALRMYRPFDNILVNGILAWTLTLQGTWLAHVGYIVHGPEEWDQDDYDSGMLAVCFFILHALGILVGMAVFYTVVVYLGKYFVTRRLKRQRLGRL